MKHARESSRWAHIWHLLACYRFCAAETPQVCAGKYHSCKVRRHPSRVSSKRQRGFPQRKAKVIKTWLNGWITSHRMHEDLLHECLLGCPDQADKLAHYVMCPRIYATALFFVSSTSSNPLERIGLLHPSQDSLLICACTFSAYHGLKAKIRASWPDSDLKRKPFCQTNNDL